MQEAKDLIDMSAPYMSYILPGVFVLSFMTFADLILDFTLNLISRVKSRVRF